jgi:hypothetical protein
MNPIRLSDIQNRIYEGNFERLFALCEKCLWSATIFKSNAQESTIILGICPACFNEGILLVPLVYIRIYNRNTSQTAPRKRRILN